MAKTFTGESISANTRKDKVSNGTLTGNYYQDLDNQLLKCVSNPTILTKNIDGATAYSNNYIVDLRKVGNVSDTLDLVTGKVTRRIKSAVMPGGENVQLYGIPDMGAHRTTLQVQYINFFGDSAIGFQTSISNKMENVNNIYGLDIPGYSDHPTLPRKYVNIEKSKIPGFDESLTTLQQLNLARQWLVDNPVMVYYQLASSTEEYIDVNPLYSLNNYTHYSQTQSVKGNMSLDLSLDLGFYSEETTANMILELDGIDISDCVIDSYTETWESEVSDEFRIGCFPSKEVKLGLDMNMVKRKFAEKLAPNLVSTTSSITNYHLTGWFVDKTLTPFNKPKSYTSYKFSYDLEILEDVGSAYRFFEIGYGVSSGGLSGVYRHEFASSGQTNVSHFTTGNTEYVNEYGFACRPLRRNTTPVSGEYVKFNASNFKLIEGDWTDPDNPPWMPSTSDLPLDKPFTLKWNVSYKSEGEDLTEVIDGGTFLLDDLEEEYNGFAKATLYDRAILTDVPYDFTKLDYETGTTTVAQVQEICNHLNLELEGEEYIYNKPVKWYDNMMSVRSHLIYLAELSACNLYMTRDNKLRFSPVRPEYPQVTLPLEYVTDEFEEGDEVTFTRVLWNNGLVEYVVGNNDGSTLYVSSNNPYVDSADDIEYIYSNIQGLKVSNIKTMKVFGNPLMNVFDVIEFTDNGAHYGYTLVNSMNTSFSQAFMQKLSASVQNENYERTAKYFGDPSIKRIQIQVDNNLQKLDIISEKTDSLETNVGHLAMDYQEFKTSYSKGFVTEDGMESYVGTQISQSADEIRFTFEEALGTTEQKLEGNLSDYEEYISSFIRFVNGQIQLGNSASPFQLVITNTGITINNNGSPVAYFQSEKMLITKAEITQSLQIGNVAFMPDANGSMSLRKV